MTTELSLSGFAERLIATIRSQSASDLTDETFNARALDLFTLQFAAVPAYRRLCETRGIVPGQVSDWREIPALPTHAFKEFDVTSLAPAARTTVFHSSQTTRAQPSRHFHSLASLGVYEVSLLDWFRRHLWHDEARRSEGPLALSLVILTPPRSLTPHSSLVHMFETIRKSFEFTSTAYLGSANGDGGWCLNCQDAVGNIERNSNQPMLLLGTAFNFVQLCDHLVRTGRQLRLPAGSRALETGGYKGRSRVLSKSELYALLGDALGLESEQIISEYGMSELSSQAYDGTVAEAGARFSGVAERLFRFPPWARVQIVSPETGKEVGLGETGLIRVMDLANVFSVANVQTEDLGRRRRAGFELVGRAALAEARGCSLLAT